MIARKEHDPHPPTFPARWVTLLLLAGCSGCPQPAADLTWVAPIDAPLGVMYFCPYWPMHQLSHSCDARMDAPCAFAELGLPAIKLEDIRWKNIEARAPTGGVHQYDWSVLDDAVLRWQAAGARRLQFHLNPSSSWGIEDSRPIAEGRFGLACNEIPGRCEDLPTNPLPERWGDWEAFVTALCERYDGDGVDDMEGLHDPQLAFELLNEGQNWFFYLGSSEDYSKLLQHTRAALDACGGAPEIIHYGVTFNGMSHGGVDDDTYWARVAEKQAALDPVLYGPGLRHAHDMMLGSPDPGAAYDAVATLSMCEHFDVVDMHCNMGIAHMVEEYAFLRGKLDGFGCEGVDILCGDTTSAPALYSPSELEWWDSSWGGTDSSGERIHAALGEGYATYTSTCNPDGLDPGLSYEEAAAWYERYHAAFVVKKAATALALGMTGYMAGLLEDWAPVSGCYWMYQGLTASEVELFGLAPVDYGAPKPAYRSLRLLGEKLVGAGEASREVVDGVTVLTFAREGAAPLYLVWYLDDDMPAPGEAESTRGFELEVGTAEVRVTRLVTEAGEESPSTENVATSEGVYAGVASQTPIFLEGVE